MRMRASEVCRRKEGGWKRPKASIQDQGRSLLLGVGCIESSKMQHLSCNPLAPSALSPTVNIQGNRNTDRQKKAKKCGKNYPPAQRNGD